MEPAAPPAAAAGEPAGAFRIGELLVQAGAVTAERVEEAVAAQAGTGQRLGEILAGARAADTPRGSEAAAHVAPGPNAVRTFAPPPQVVRQPLDPFAAQPLE